MKIKQIVSAALSAAVMLTSIMAMPFTGNAVPSARGEMRDISTQELVRDMGVGINLGNTLECAGDWIAQWGDGTVNSYETAWGAKPTTREMIHGMKEEGFGVVRVPVAWSNLMDMSTYTISADYMKRVQEVVDWVLDEGMYAIINIHWDNEWVNNFPDNKDESMRRYVRMWEQIAEGFQEYGDHLIFESQNEELGWNSMWNQWSNDPPNKTGSYELVNEINQKFVDVVRSSGGNNPERHLLISGYNTGIDLTCDPLFHMPNDPKNRCAVSVHYYNPSTFAILEEDADWGKMRSTWGTDDDFRDLAYQMDMMKNTFVDKGVPVIIGEYGCPTTNKELSSVRLFLKSVCTAAYERQMCPVLWSTPGGHYNRDTCQMEDAEMGEYYRQYKVNRAPALNPADQPTEPETTEAPTEPETTEAPTEPEPETTEAPTEPTEIATEPTDVPGDELPPVSIYGDVDGNNVVNIVDVIALNKNLMIGEPLSPQGRSNADVDNNGLVTEADSLNILKSVVKLITLPV